MNNLLIVDDEKEILDWLEELFLYEYPPQIEVYTAASALDALVLLQKIQFDVVLTDIKMPGMGGLKLFYEIKENWPGCKVVFLTGYRNFDDIYEVIQHSDVRYVLKSEDDETIMKAVNDSFVELRSMLEQEQISKIQQSKIERAKFWLKRDMFQTLISQPELFCSDQERKELGINIDLFRKMLIFLLRFDSQAAVRRLETDYFGFSRFEEMLSAYLPKRICLHAHALVNGYILLIFQPDTEKNAAWDNIYAVTKGALEYAQITYEKSYKETFCAVVSSEPREFSEILSRINQLKRIMVGYMSVKDTAILHAETLVNQREEAAAETEERPGNIQLLKYHLELRQRDEYLELLTELCRRMASDKGHHNLLSMEIYYRIAVTLLQFINNSHIYEQLAFEIGLYKLLNSNEHDNWIEAGEYLRTLSEAIFRVLGNSENTLANRALERITAYIDQNISGDLTLTNLARVGGFNASYLSRLFKNAHKMTVTDYVVRKRMETAKQFLVTSTEKIQNIAEKTGYTSSHSFSRAFRNHTGVSPIEYREIHAKI